MSLPFVSVVRPHLYFGPYPTQPQIEQLESVLGVQAVVNLTCHNEMLDPYVLTSAESTYLHLPIEDNSVPDDVPLFCALIYKVYTILRSGVTTYVHCKGGHGRSGMVCAILLCLLEGLSPAAGIVETTEAHKTRPQLRDFWKTRPCPHLHIQRKFVYRMFTPLHWSPHTPISISKGFSPWSPHRIVYDGHVFETSSEALQQYDATSVMQVKFIQHPDLLHSLLWTGFRPFQCKGDEPDEHNLSAVLYAVKVNYFHTFDRIPWTHEWEVDGISKSHSTPCRSACEES